MPKSRVVCFPSAAQEIPTPFTPSTPKPKTRVRIMLDAELVDALKRMSEAEDRRLPAMIALSLRYAVRQHVKGAELVRLKPAPTKQLMH